MARDATLQLLVGGREYALRVIRERSGKAFDPDVVAALLGDGGEALELPETGSLWEEVLQREPTRLVLKGAEVDEALAAMGDFADLVSPYFIGHSAGVAELAGEAASRMGLEPADIVAARRAALVHDLGRVAISTSIWNKPGPLTAAEWEHIRLHPYYTERVLAPSISLAQLAPIASAHHERIDGSGYHRGLSGPMVTMPARVVAAADAYHTMTEPRPHRAAIAPEAAGQTLAAAARTRRLDPDAVAAVLGAAGQAVPKMPRPAGLTDREAQVIGLVARGLQTKQIGHRLGISTKTADRHLQNAYAKIGVSTRAAAAMFAMQHGLTSWGELPIPHLAAAFLALTSAAVGSCSQAEVVMAIHRGDPILVESSEPRTRRAVHPILAWAGIAAPVIFTAVFWAQEAFRRLEYDPLAEPVSALEAGPAGWIQQVSFVIFGLLTMVTRSGCMAACCRLAVA